MMNTVYCGPGTLLPNRRPKNAVDAMCMRHDYCYGRGRTEQECDNIMLKELDTITCSKYPRLDLACLGVKAAMNLKRRLGIEGYKPDVGLSDSQRNDVEEIIEWYNPGSLDLTPVAASTRPPPKAGASSVSDTKMPGTKRKAAATSTKRMRADVVAVGQDYTLKPVGNMSIPSDATMTDININTTLYLSLKGCAPGKEGKKQWGQVLEYHFPTCEDAKACAGPLTPNTKLPVQQLYDVDVHEILNKDPGHISWNALNGYFKSYSDNPTEVKKWSTASINNYDTGAAQIKGSGYSDPDELIPRPFFVYVVRKSQQAALGKWIEDNKGLGTQAATVSPALFDDFCYKVKPTFAKLYLFEFEAVTNPHHANINGKVYEVPEATSTQSFTVHEREFHYWKNVKDVAPSMTYANKLLIGTYGKKSSFNRFRSCTVTLYHKPVTVPAETLFFMEEHGAYTSTVDSGDRKQFGSNTRHTPGEFAGAGDYNLNGNMTCQSGELELFADGTLTDATAEGNILLNTVTEKGTWYWYVFFSSHSTVDSVADTGGTNGSTPVTSVTVCNTGNTGNTCETVLVRPSVSNV